MLGCQCSCRRPLPAPTAQCDHTHVHPHPCPCACRCVFQKEDDNGHVGVSLNRDLVKVAGRALERNLTTLGPLVLPLSEKLRYVVNYVRRKMLQQRRLKPYVPDFKKAFDHFCLHAGVPPVEMPLAGVHECEKQGVGSTGEWGTDMI